MCKKSPGDAQIGSRSLRDVRIGSPVCRRLDERILKGTGLRAGRVRRRLAGNVMGILRVAKRIRPKNLGLAAFSRDFGDFWQL
jgi:hypothetical protein